MAGRLLLISDGDLVDGEAFFVWSMQIRRAGSGIQMVVVQVSYASLWFVQGNISLYKSELELSVQIFKKIFISNVMKIHPVGAALFHADRQTDMMKLIIAFHNFVKMPEK